MGPKKLVEKVEDVFDEMTASVIMLFQKKSGVATWGDAAELLRQIASEVTKGAKKAAGYSGIATRRSREDIAAEKEGEQEKTDNQEAKANEQK